MISSSASLLHCIVFVIIALAWTGSDTSVAGSPMELVSGDQVARKARVGEEIVSTYKVEDLPRFDAENFRLQAQEAFKIGKKVLVVMDVSGTIRERGTNTPKTIELREGILNELERDKGYIPYLNSGGTDKDMMKEFSTHENIGMYAEHGCVLRQPGSHDFVALFENKPDWREPITKIIEEMKWENVRYAADKEYRIILILLENKALTEDGERFITRDGNTVAIRDFEKAATKDLKGFYESFKGKTENMPIYHSITEDGACIEVTHQDYNKATAIKHLVAHQNDIGLVLAAGDTVRDADMHSEVRISMQKKDVRFHNIIIKKGGCKTTEANYQLEDSQELLEALAHILGLKAQTSYAVPTMASPMGASLV